MKKRILLYASSLVLALSTVSPLYAQEVDPHYFTNNNIIFYGIEPALKCSFADLPPTTAKLPADVIKNIETMKSVYQDASAQTKIPWQVFAAIDYRESNNAANKSMLGGEPLGQPATDSGLTPHTKLESVLMGANILSGLAREVYGVDVTKPMDFDKLQKAFITYNRGHSYKRANQPPDTSPYVMNQYDDSHKNMTFPNIPGETLAGRTETSRFGALTVYANLITTGDAGETSADGCTGVGVGAKVNYTGIYPDLDAGKLPANLLCTPRPSQPGFKLLKGPACESFIAMDAAYKAVFKRSMPVGGGYRPASIQIECGGTVDNPGGSNPACAPYNPKNDPPEHLWGTAIDFSGPLFNDGTPEHDWLVKNGPEYGWFWPNWAKSGRGGTAGVFEPWHFAYYFKGHDPTTDKLESYK